MDGQSGVRIWTFFKRKFIFLRMFITLVKIGSNIEINFTYFFIPFLSIENDLEFSLNQHLLTIFLLKVLVEVS